MNESKTAYFSAINANQRIAGVAFEPVGLFAGTVMGVFHTDDPSLIESMSKHLNVTKISDQEYGELLKKKAPAWNDYVNSNRHSSSPVALKEIVGVVVESQSNAAPTGVVAENLLEPRPIDTPPPIGRRKK